MEQVQLALDVDYSEELSCEYPVAWRNPEHEVFEGVTGDLFNGTNYVTIVQTGNGVPDGFSASGVEFMDGGWEAVAARGFAAVVLDQLVFAIPASEFGSAGDQLRRSSVDFFQGTDEGDSVADFNFGAFCSEDGRSFDLSVGGVDILQVPVDLAGLPVSVVGPVSSEPPATTTIEAVTSTTSTTVASTQPTPSTTLVAPGTDEGGVDPLLIALLIGGVGGAAYGAWKWAQIKAEDSRGVGGSTFRIEMEGGLSASFSEVAGLDLEDVPIEYCAGFENDASTMKQPGISKTPTIVLKRGITDSQAFYDWARSASEDDALGGSLVMESLQGPALEWTFERGGHLGGTPHPSVHPSPRHRSNR